MSNWRNYVPFLKAVSTAVNPTAGIIVSLVDNLYFKPKEKAKQMLEGKKTYVGIAVAIIPILGKMFGYEATAEFQEGATLIINDLIALAGMAMATYGRAKTKGNTLFAKK